MYIAAYSFAVWRTHMSIYLCHPIFFIFNYSRIEKKNQNFKCLLKQSMKTCKFVRWWFWTFFPFFCFPITAISLFIMFKSPMIQEPCWEASKITVMMAVQKAYLNNHRKMLWMFQLSMNLCVKIREKEADFGLECLVVLLTSKCVFALFFEFLHSLYQFFFFVA